MIGTGGISSGSGLVRMLCALSLLLVAFAHRPLALETVPSLSSADVASFMLPDGTLPDLCLTGENDGADHFAASHCEACRIASSVDVPPPFDAYVITRWSAQAELSIHDNARLAYPALRPGASPRGPPSFTA